MSILKTTSVYLRRQESQKKDLAIDGFLTVNKVRLTNKKIFDGLCRAFTVYPVRAAAGAIFTFEDYSKGTPKFVEACKELYTHLCALEVFREVDMATPYMVVGSGETNVSGLDNLHNILATIAVEGGFVDEVQLETIGLEVAQLRVIFVDCFHAQAKLTEFFTLMGQNILIYRFSKSHTVEENIKRVVEMRKRKAAQKAEAVKVDTKPKSKGKSKGVSVEIEVSRELKIRKEVIKALENTVKEILEVTGYKTALKLKLEADEPMKKRRA